MTRSGSHGRSQSGNSPSHTVSDLSPHEDTKQKLQSLLADIWKRSQQMEIDRVEILLDAQTAASSGRLDEPGRRSAMEAAHKLAGALGTFGLSRGTDLARELESAFRAGIPNRAAADSMRAAVEELGALIHSAGPQPPA